MHVLKNIQLLITCFLQALFLGVPRRAPSPPKNVLFVSLGKLGDMVCLTPMFHAVKQRYPDCGVTVMGTAVNKLLLTQNADVDEYMIFENAGTSTKHAIRQKRFDAAILPSPNFELLALLIRARIPCIAAHTIVNGTCPYEGLGYRLLRKLVFVLSHRMGTYAPTEFLRLLRPLGIESTDTKKHLGFTPAAQTSVQTFLRTKFPDGTHFVGIAPGAGNQIKLWGEKKFAELADYVANRYHASIIIVGAKSDKPFAERMIASLDPKTPYADTTDRFSIDELKALIKEFRIFISVDSGPIYVAETFGTPTVDIVGPMDEREMPPQGNHHVVVVPANRSEPATHIMNSRPKDPAEARRQVESITVDMVKNAVDKLFRQLL